MRSRQILLRLVLFHSCLVIPAAWAGGNALHIEVNKVPQSTAALVRLDGEMEVPHAALEATLCDYEAHSKFSEVTERAAVVTLQEAKAFEATNPQKRSGVAPQVIPGRIRAACPGRTYVLTLFDFPFPMRDGWSLARYDAAFTGASFQVEYDTLIGSDKGSGKWTVTPVSETRSRLVMNYYIDLGVPMPGFLFTWVMNSQMPQMFKAIEAEARKRVRK